MNRPCDECGLQMIADRQWRQLSHEARKEHQARGVTRHAGRGVCHNCKSRLTRVEQDARSARVDSDVVAEEWAWLANPWRSDDENAAELAPRLGMDPHTLMRQVYRLRRKGRLEKAREWVA